MAIQSGARLGPYEILAPLGAGGMGEVYRARDTRLERIVAIKVLPPQLAHDPEFRARFEREAKTISALTHPNICTLYDAGREGDVEFLVMEFLEGESLAARIGRGPIPGEEALDYAIQIADALDKAHRFGITHRDLKPANIFLVKGQTASGPGVCKLLDFGLAKIGPVTSSGVMETKLVTSPPDQAPLTARGSILGTFQYMAPEQIEGHDADARSDIWAFGCVLYEMLTGRRAFEGKSQASLIATILERPPVPIAELQPMTPPAVGRIVRTCLEKSPEDRFHTAHDLRLHLQWIEEGGSAAGLPAPVIARRRRHEKLLYGAAGLAAVILAAAGVWALRPTPEPAGVVGRFSIALPPEQNFSRAGRRVIAISPDGRQFAYVANQQIYLRRMNELAAAPIRGTQSDPLDIVFSPDGEWIAFFTPASASGPLTNAALRKVSVSGGVPITLATNINNPTGIRWQGGTLIYGVNGQAFEKIAETGGAPQKLLSVPDESTERVAQAQLVNDGKDILYTVRESGGSWNDGRIVVQALGGGEPRVLVHGGTDGRLSPSGDQLIWIRDSTLFAMPVERGSLKPTGGARPVIERVRQAAFTGAGQYFFSDDGTLVYGLGSGDAAVTLVWVDRDGKEEVIAAPRQRYTHPRLSPDGNRIAVDSRDGDSDIWIWDETRKTMTKLSAGPDEDAFPIWSRDGRSILHRANTPAGALLLKRAADGTGAVVEFRKGLLSPAPQSLLADGSLLIRLDLSADANPSLAVVPASGGEPKTPFRTQEAHAVGEVSPDGRWLAYQSSESSTQAETYVRPFPDSETGRWKISTEGGGMPVWARSGRELFFVTRRPAMLMAVNVERSDGGVFKYGPARPLFNVTPYAIGAFGRSYDVSPDGRRFLMLKREADETVPELIVISNWFKELARAGR